MREARRGAVRVRARRGRRQAAARDVLADVLAVFRDDAGLHWAEAAARLAQAFPGRWDGVTADALSAELRARGVPCVQRQGRRRGRPRLPPRRRREGGGASEGATGERCRTRS